MSVAFVRRLSIALLAWTGVFTGAGGAVAAPPPFLPPPAPAVDAAFAPLAPWQEGESADWPAALWDEWAANLRDARDLGVASWTRIGPNRWAGPDLAADRLLSAAPAEGRAAWQRVVASRAQRLMEEAADDSSDPLPPFTLARDLIAAPAGRRAAGELAAAAFREGRTEEARRRWVDRARLAPDGPLSDQAAEDWANVVFADLAAGRFALAEREREQFLAAFPDARPDWATPFDRARWPSRAVPERTRAPQQSATRDGRLRALPAPFATPAARAVAADGPSWATPRLDEAGDAAFPSHPAIWGDAALYSTGRRIVGLDLRTGRPRWPIDPADDGTLFPPPTGLGPSPPAFRPPDREPPPVGSARPGVALFGPFALARLGDPAVEWPPRALRIPTSSLVCLNLEREGELTWERPASALRTSPDDETGWSWEGTPAPGLDPLTGAPRVFAVARRNRPSALLEVVALDLPTGEILWRTPLGAARSVPAPAVRTVSSTVPTLCGGRLFVDTGAGAVACVDAADGRPVWLTAHDRDPNAAASSSLPPAVVGGRVFLTPTGAPGVRALDAATGAPLWSRDLPGVGERILGVAANRLLIAAPGGLWGLHPATGETAWFVPAPHVVPGPLDPHAAGLIGAATAAWVTADRVLLIDAATGEERGEVPLAEVGVRAGVLAAGPAAAVLLTPRALLGWTGQAGVREFPLAER